MTRAGLILNELKAHGVTHVVGLPDNTSARLFALLENDPDVRLVQVTREGEAFALAAGLWVGGKKPVVLAQNTGLFESGDAIRGTLLRMRIPVVCLITYRGYAKLIANRKVASSERLSAEDLSRPDLDSAALFTESTLSAWSIPYEIVHDDADTPMIARAFALSEEESRTVAVLISGVLQ